MSEWTTKEIISKKLNIFHKNICSDNKNKVIFSKNGSGKTTFKVIDNPNKAIFISTTEQKNIEGNNDQDWSESLFSYSVPKLSFSDKQNLNKLFKELNIPVQFHKNISTILWCNNKKINLDKNFKTSDLPLSKGERKFFHISYYFMLHADNKRTAFIDDPVETLDVVLERSLINFLVGNIKKYKNIIVFTHNISTFINFNRKSIESNIFIDGFLFKMTNVEMNSLENDKLAAMAFNETRHEYFERMAIERSKHIFKTLGGAYENTYKFLDNKYNELSNKKFNYKNQIFRVNNFIDYLSFKGIVISEFREFIKNNLTKKIKRKFTPVSGTITIEKLIKIFYNEEAILNSISPSIVATIKEIKKSNALQIINNSSHQSIFHNSLLYVNFESLVFAIKQNSYLWKIFIKFTKEKSDDEIKIIQNFIDI